MKTMHPVVLAPLISIPLLLSGLAASPAFANDSSAELSVGGLVLTRTADVSLESEDLAISLEMVIVRYRFLNRTPTPLTLTVAFPLPNIDLSEGENYSIPDNDPVNFVGFETKVNGKPVSFTIHQSAHLGSEDISAKLVKSGVPLMPIGVQQTQLSQLPQSTRDQLLQQGLLLKNGTNDRGEQLYEAAWTVKTAAVRRQTFLPNVPALVEHRYHTSLGIGFDTVLRKRLRQNAAMAAEVDRYRKTYCIDDAFLQKLDRVAGTTDANTGKIQERRISYVLKTGANWAGPIKDFRLTVDKGKADRLMSFCEGPVKMISPTMVEFTAKDFMPDKDLKILILGRF
jgi:hypothetical protein